MIKTVVMLLLFAVVDGEPRAATAIVETMDECRQLAAETTALAKAGGSDLATLCIQSPQFRSNERGA